MLSFVHVVCPSASAGANRLFRTSFVSPPLCPGHHLRLPSRRPRFLHELSQRVSVKATINDDPNKTTDASKISERGPSEGLNDSAGNNISEGADSRSDEESSTSGTREPVEDGVALPDVNGEELRVESSWLEIEIRSWLDDEWRSAEAWKAHRGIAHRTAQLYGHLRAERVNDLSTLMLGLGAGLEGGTNSADFSNTYVGPWTIANKAAELVLARFYPDRAAQIEAEERSEISKTWSVLDDTLRDFEEAQGSLDKEGAGGGKKKETGPHRPVSPNLADKFERYRFLQMILDGSVSKPVSTFLTYTFPFCSCTVEEPPSRLGTQTRTNFQNSFTYFVLILAVCDLTVDRWRGSHSDGVLI